MVPRHDKSTFLHQRSATPSFRPTPRNGPWDPKSLHGRVIIGLLAFVIEQRHGADDFVPARLTVDMFRLPTLGADRGQDAAGPRRPAHQGGRGRFLLAAASPWRAPPASCCARPKTRKAWCGRRRTGRCRRPSDIPAPTDPRLGMNGKWTTRPIIGAMGTVGPRRLWMSEVRDLVEGSAADAVRAGRGGGGFRQPLRQCRRSGPRLHQQRRHAVSASPAGDAMDRLRGGEPPRHRRHRDRRMLALRRAGPDRHLHGRGPGAAQADGQAEPPP